MKSTGVVRKIDELGRIVLPKEVRSGLGIDSKDDLEIFIDGEELILKKTNSSCVICGSNVHLIDYKGKGLCKSCVDGLQY